MRSALPRQASAYPGRSGELLDGALASESIVAVLLVGIVVVRGISPFYMMVDPGAIPWGHVWDGLEKLGLATALARGSYWAWRKLSGEDQYFQKIWTTLDDSPVPLTKDVISSQVEKSIKKFRLSMFERTWQRMRMKGYIHKVDVPGAYEAHFTTSDFESGREANEAA